MFIITPANMVVRTNIFSLNAHRNMKNTGLEQQRASNRLASAWQYAGTGYANLDTVITRGDFLALRDRIVTERTAIDGRLINGVALVPPTGAVGNVTTAEVAVTGAEIALETARIAAVNGAGVAELHFQIGANSEESLMHNFAELNLTIALSQAATTMLAQANQIPNNLLQILR